jgi:DNA-directed RNA polymerase specialized sigma24 family protein
MAVTGMSDAEYLRLFAKLKKYFEWRNCIAPEDLAQETMLRGIRRLAEGKVIYAEHNENFFMGIARNVLMEERKKPAWEPPPDLEQADERDQAGACFGRILLRECLATLNEKDRELIIGYIHDGPEPTAEAHGLTPNALRVRISRIRARIEETLNGITD